VWKSPKRFRYSKKAHVFSAAHLLFVLYLLLCRVNLSSFWLLSLLSFNFRRFACYHPITPSIFCVFGKQVNTALTELDLWGNSIGADGAEHIAEAVKVGCVLRVSQFRRL
jgi:hypothetical protein